MAAVPNSKIGFARSFERNGSRCLRFSLREMMVLMGVICTVCAIFVGYYRSRLAAWHEAEQMTCDSRMYGIALALYQYHQEFGCFPPAYVADASGKPMHSWRVLVLASAPYPARYVFESYRLDEPWNGPHNRTLEKAVAELYACPNHPRDPASPYTNYVAITGPGTLFPGARSESFGAVGSKRSAALTIVEVADARISWMEPKDLDVEAIELSGRNPTQPRVSSYDPDGPGIGFGDGHCIRVGRKAVDARLRREVEKLLRLTASHSKPDEGRGGTHND